MRNMFTSHFTHEYAIIISILFYYYSTKIEMLIFVLFLNCIHGTIPQCQKKSLQSCIMYEASCVKSIFICTYTNPYI